MSRWTETSWGKVDDVAFVSLFKPLSLLLTCCAINIHVNGPQRLTVILLRFFLTVELKASAEALLFVRVIKSLRMSRESMCRVTKWLCESLIISSVCLTENQRNIYSESHGGLSPEPAEAPYVDQSQPSQSGSLETDWLVCHLNSNNARWSKILLKLSFFFFFFYPLFHFKELKPPVKCSAASEPEVSLALVILVSHHSYYRS